jgi:hypothetical protein
VSNRSPVIVGVGLSDYPVAPHLDEAQHHALALQRALQDCGVAKQEIDGYACAGGMTPRLIRPSQWRSTSESITGGSTEL